MPLATIESAVCSTSVSLMSEANVFQVFQPIGGVRASPSNFPGEGGCGDCGAEEQAEVLFSWGLGGATENGGRNPRVVKPPAVLVPHRPIFGMALFRFRG
jgi:hypothetical protein